MPRWLKNYFIVFFHQFYIRLIFPHLFVFHENSVRMCFDQFKFNSNITASFMHHPTNFLNQGQLKQNVTVTVF